MTGTGLKLRRERAKLGGSASKGSPMGRERNPVDKSSYQGRLALHLVALREAAGLTVQDVADRTGIPLSTLYAYEGGTRGIPADLYPQLAKLFRVTAAEFLPKFPAR